MRFDLPSMEDIRSAGAQHAAGVPMMLSVEDIDEDPEQPRKEFDEDSLAQLAATIAGRGVRQPVSVRRHPERPGRWILNFGARRLRAARLAGEATIAAFEDAAADSYDQVIENEQREGLKPLEIALFIKRQLDRGQSRADIARGIGKSQPYITYASSLIDPPDWLMDIYRSGKCRGMLELHELRRLHSTNAQVVEAYVTGVEHVGRTELQQLKTRLAQAEKGTPPEDGSREEGGQSQGVGESAARRPEELADPHALVASRQVATAAAPASGPLNPIKAAGEGPTRRPAVARKVVVRARHGGATVRVLLDEVPEAPSSVFVLAEDGVRVVVSVDELAHVELDFEPSLQS